MTITLREINKDNWRTAAKLNLTEQQKTFIAPNWYSMLQVVYSGGELYDRGIYLDDEMIGYTMMGQDPANKRCYIDRFMIALEHQGKGHGRVAMHAIIDALKTRYNPDSIFITFEPENAIARKLYESLGFVDTGELDDGELVFRLPLTS